MAKIRWLHISDLHFDASMGEDPYDVNKVLGPLLNTVKQRRDQGCGPDLVFVTGDIGSKGKADDYKPCKKFLTDLLSRANLPREHLWLVPGNHDIDRAAGKFLARTLANKEQSQEFFGRPDYRNAHQGKFKNYIAFLNEFFPERQLAPGDVVHQPAIVEVNGFRFGVLPLNSAWFSQDDNDRGNLWIGVRTVQERVELLKKQSPPVDLTLALLHHPFSYLHEAETAAGWIRDACHIVLRGHLHRTDAETISASSGGTILVAAGATYQGSDKPCRAFFATLDPERWTVRLEPIQYIDAPAANTWTIDPTVFPDRENEKYTREYQLRLRAFVSPPLSFPDFPYKDWRTINTAGWLSAVVDWFIQTYRKAPQKAMQKTLDHVFDIVSNTQRARQPNLHQHVMDLGKALRSNLSQGLPSEQWHHGVILELLELGIHHNLSHLFMLPQVDKHNLLNVPDYSRLLLSTRYLAAGRYKEADLLAREVGVGCCISLYVMGQCARKMEFLHEAKQRLIEANQWVDRFNDNAYSCPYSEGLKVICNEHLLRAEVHRALGVVYRKLQQKEEAEEHFRIATDAAKKALDVAPPIASSQQMSRNVISPSYDMAPYRVVADVHFSHGYYWYEQRDFTKAEELFCLSIKALEQAEEEWDSPYTRLAIIKWRFGQIDEAKELFLKAQEICKRTSPTKNREAPLSLALCTLGLKAIELAYPSQRLTNTDPLDDLERALRMQPPLALGPLYCHLNDANNLLIEGGSNPYSDLVNDLVNRFTDRLKEAIKSLIK